MAISVVDAFRNNDIGRFDISPTNTQQTVTPWSGRGHFIAFSRDNTVPGGNYALVSFGPSINLERSHFQIRHF